MVLESKTHRKYLLDNANYIQEKTPGSLKKVIVVRDLTPRGKRDVKDLLIRGKVAKMTNKVLVE